MARPARQDEVAQQRRRRQPGTLDRMDQLKLAVPDKAKEAHPNSTFRWVNDTPGRMHNLTVKDDWDVVKDVEPLAVGTDQAGQPIYARLCAKPLEFWEEDQRAKAKAVREQQNELIRKGDEKTAADAATYVKPGNSIETKAFEP